MSMSIRWMPQGRRCDLFLYFLLFSHSDGNRQMKRWSSVSKWIESWLSSTMCKLSSKQVGKSERERTVVYKNYNFIMITIRSTWHYATNLHRQRWKKKQYVSAGDEQQLNKMMRFR